MIEARRNPSSLLGRQQVVRGIGLHLDHPVQRINKITWQNSCRFFGWDPFKHTARDQATVGALRAKGADVDVSIRPRAEWARLYNEKQFART